MKVCVCSHAHKGQPCPEKDCGCTIYEPLPNLDSWHWSGSEHFNGAQGNTKAPYPLDNIIRSTN